MGVVELAPNLEYGFGLHGGPDVTKFDELVLKFLSGTILDTFGEDRIVKDLVDAYKLGRSDARNGVPDIIPEDADGYIKAMRGKLEL